jgi:hypothetical protein
MQGRAPAGVECPVKLLDQINNYVEIIAAFPVKYIAKKRKNRRSIPLTFMDALLHNSM